MRKTIEINGKVFELCKSDVHVSDNVFCGVDCNEIYKVYHSPSIIKVKIWTEWCNWCFDNIHNDIPCTLKICSHNSNKFSISGMVLIDGHIYRLWITKDHNRAYLVV